MVTLEIWWSGWIIQPDCVLIRQYLFKSMDLKGAPAIGLLLWFHLWSYLNPILCLHRVSMCYTVYLFYMQCDLPSETNQQTMDDFCKDNSFLGYFPTSAKEDIGIGDAARGLVAEVLTYTHIGPHIHCTLHWQRCSACARLAHCTVRICMYTTCVWIYTVHISYAKCCTVTADIPHVWDR